MNNVQRFYLLIVISFICNSVVYMQDKQESPLKIGIVNMKRVFEESLEAKDIKNALEKEQKEVESRISDLEKKMKELQDEIQQLAQTAIPSGSLTLSEKRRELNTLKANYEYEKQDWNQRIRDKINKFTLDLYNKFKKTIEEYGIQNKFTLILKVEEKDLAYDPTYPTDERIRPRTVVYYRNELDITQLIIDAINKGYLEEKTGSKK